MTAYGNGGSNPASGPVKGAFFWNFRLESDALIQSPMWSYLEGLEKGWMPTSPDQWSIPGCPGGK